MIDILKAFRRSLPLLSKEPQWILHFFIFTYITTLCKGCVSSSFNYIITRRRRGCNLSTTHSFVFRPRLDLTIGVTVKGTFAFSTTKRRLWTSTKVTRQVLQRPTFFVIFQRHTVGWKYTFCWRINEWMKDNNNKIEITMGIAMLSKTPQSSVET